MALIYKNSLCDLPIVYKISLGFILAHCIKVYEITYCFVLLAWHCKLDCMSLDNVLVQVLKTQIWTSFNNDVQCCLTNVRNKKRYRYHWKDFNKTM